MADRKRKAVALKFDSGTQQAPTVAAAGHNLQADKIIQAAVDAGVPVRQDPLLADALSQLEVGWDIPAELYAAVAEALVWAWNADRAARSGS